MRKPKPSRPPHPLRAKFLKALWFNRVSMTQWAESHGVRCPTVSQVLSGRDTSERLDKLIRRYADRYGNKPLAQSPNGR